MARVKNSELVHLAEMINTRLGITDPDEQYEIHRAYGSPRLERARGSVDVSPRLPAGQLADWQRAFLAGIGAGQIEPTGEALLPARLVGALADLRVAIDDEDGGNDPILDAALIVLDVAGQRHDPVADALAELVESGEVLHEVGSDLYFPNNSTDPPISAQPGWRICMGCHEAYNPDDAELHERCAS